MLTICFLQVHIIRHVETFTHPGSLYAKHLLITEWCEQGSIVAEGRRKRFTYLEIVKIVGQIAASLTWLHAHGYAHRAIRPEYIVVRSRTDSSIEVCLSKFAFATQIPPVTIGVDESVAQDLFTVVQQASKKYYGEKGKLLAIDEKYIAPDPFSPFMERRTDHLKHPSAVDVWSLGVVALELVTGSLPIVLYNKGGVRERNPLRVEEDAYVNNIRKHKTKLVDSANGRDWLELPLVFLIAGMTNMEPGKRFTAEYVYNTVAEILNNISNGGKYPEGVLTPIAPTRFFADGFQPFEPIPGSKLDFVPMKRKRGD